MLSTSDIKREAYLIALELTPEEAVSLSNTDLERLYYEAVAAGEVGGGGAGIPFGPFYSSNPAMTITPAGVVTNPPRFATIDFGDDQFGERPLLKFKYGWESLDLQGATDAEINLYIRITLSKDTLEIGKVRIRSVANVYSVFPISDNGGMSATDPADISPEGLGFSYDIAHLLWYNEVDKNASITLEADGVSGVVGSFFFEHAFLYLDVIPNAEETPD